MGVLVATIYVVVPAIVGGLAFGVGALAAVSDSGAISAAGALFALGAVSVTLALSLAALYVLPAALANYARTDRVADAFSMTTLRPALVNRQYATGRAYAFVTVVAANGLVDAVVFFAGIGAVFAPSVSFYASVTAAYIVGRTWNAMESIETHGNGRASERPVV